MSDELPQADDVPTRRQLREAIALAHNAVIDWEIKAADYRCDAEAADEEKRRAEVHLAHLIELYDATPDDGTDTDETVTA